MREIPEDIMKTAREVWWEAFNALPTKRVQQGIDAAEAIIARALLAERERVASTLEFVARWAWRTDPPNAKGRRLSDGERLSAIKHHPAIKALAQSHIATAEIEKDDANS